MSFVILSAISYWMFVYAYKGVPFAQLLGHKQHASNTPVKGYKAGDTED